MVAGFMPTILVVEDEMLIRLHAADCLRESGFGVLEAADGAQALKMLEGGLPIDLVFTDIAMPGQPDGFGLAKWIRYRRPDLPFILTSGTYEVESAQAEQLGDAPFIPKPCNYEELAAYIRKLLPRA